MVPVESSLRFHVDADETFSKFAPAFFTATTSSDSEIFAEEGGVGIGVQEFR